MRKLAFDLVSQHNPQVDPYDENKGGEGPILAFVTERMTRMGQGLLHRGGHFELGEPAAGQGLDPLQWGVYGVFSNVSKEEISNCARPILLCGHLDSDHYMKVAVDSLRELPAEENGGFRAICWDFGEVGLDDKTGIAINFRVVELLSQANLSEPWVVHMYYSVGEESGQTGTIRSPLMEPQFPFVRDRVAHAIVVDRRTAAKDAEGIGRHIVTDYRSGVKLLHEGAFSDMAQEHALSRLLGHLPQLASPNMADACELRAHFNAGVLAPALLREGVIKALSGKAVEKLAAMLKLYVLNTQAAKDLCAKQKPAEKVRMSAEPRAGRYKSMIALQSAIKTCLQEAERKKHKHAVLAKLLDEEMEAELEFSTVNLSYDYKEGQKAKFNVGGVERELFFAATDEFEHTARILVDVVARWFQLAP